jgi:outer membrane murein-binding lipoprotein Lpp
MSLDLSESRLRQRRRRRLATIKWTVLFVLFVALGILAYRSGLALAEQEVRQLSSEIGRLSQDVAALQGQRDGLQTELNAARLREQEWQQRYARDVPTGEAKRIFGLVQDRLAAGVASDRIAFVVRTVDNRDTCDGRPTTKRFILPLARGGADEDGNDSISWANGVIQITGTGQAATDGRGGPYGWYDPAKPVTIRFAQLGGRGVSAVEGKLPLHHSVVRGNSEWRFTIATGSRGFVTVTGDRCTYP